MKTENCTEKHQKNIKTSFKKRFLTKMEEAYTNY